MKSSHLERTTGNGGIKIVEIQADGTRITKFTETQRLSDGSAVSKTRIARSYAAEKSPTKKVI